MNFKYKVRTPRLDDKVVNVVVLYEKTRSGVEFFVSNTRALTAKNCYDIVGRRLLSIKNYFAKKDFFRVRVEVKSVKFQSYQQ